MSYDTTVGYSTMQAKLWTSFQNIVRQIKEGKRCILFAPDYVLMSRDLYDAMIKERYPEKFEVRYDEQIDDWFRKRFLDEHKSNT